MQSLLDRSVTRLEKILEQGSPASEEKLASLIVSLPPLQDAYEAMLSDALTLLARGLQDECRHQLRLHREELSPSLGRLSPIISRLMDSDHDLLKQIVEYLYTRARVVDEINMFPEFGLEVMNASAGDDSLQQVIAKLEYAMTGKQKLYADIMASYEAMKSPE